jgi:hypothetical protein
MRKTWRAAAGAAVLAAGTLGPIAWGASAAHAAEVQCNTVLSKVRVSNGSILSIPALYPSLSAYNCIVVRGMRDSSTAPGPVGQLQVTLRTCYHKSYVGLDGDFGPVTERAAREVQAAVGVSVDGRYGPRTMAAMRHQSDDVLHCYKITD